MTRTLYAVALGHNQSEANLTPLDPQPHSPGVVPGRREYPAAGGVYEDIHHIELNWPILDGDEDYRGLLVQLGLNEADTANVTLRIRDDNFLDWVINATVYRPEHGRELGWQIFPRGLRILARDLEEVE